MERTASSQGHARQTQAQYVCFVRFPFPRGDFLDPEPVSWDIVKDRQLWKIVSKATDSRDLDWADLSERFQVPLQFLLQQAAWLYERHFAQMKAQMKKLGNAGQTTQGLASGSNEQSLGSSHLASDVQAAHQAPGHSSRTTSAMSVNRKDSPTMSTGSLRRPTSRTSINTRSPPGPNSTTTRQTATAARRPASRTSRDSFGSSHTIEAPLVRRALPALSSTSDSTSTDEGEQRRSSRSEVDTPHGYRDGGALDDGSDEDLPFASHHVHETTATLRDRTDSGDTIRRARPDGEYRPGTQAEVRYDTEPGDGHRRAAAGLLSAGSVPDPRQRSHLTPNTRQENSDGAPSMGSSYSDLDGDSLTQSALEDALLSNMRQGGVASRMSTISQALRSKYLS